MPAAPLLRLFAQRTTVFIIGTFLRFSLFIGLGLVYCAIVGIECWHHVPEDYRMLVYRVIPATTVGFVAGMGVLWRWRGEDGLLSSKEVAVSALVGALVLDASYLWGTILMHSMVQRRSVQLVCTFVLTLGFGAFRAWRRSGTSAAPAAGPS